MRRCYLDHNATAPIRETVVSGMTAALRHCGNPSSVHEPGRAARKAVEAGRAELRQALHLGGDATVVFTSGGTEANLLALTGHPWATRLVGATEHASIRDAAVQAIRLPVDGDGLIEIETLKRRLADAAGPVLVSIHAANNETGVLQPLAEIATVTKAAGAILHCDAVQWIGRLDFPMLELGVDMATVSAHKIGGPMGIGALVLRPGLTVSARPGGGQESGLRPGTENVAGIVGFGTALAEAVTEFGEWSGHVAPLRDSLIDVLRAASPDIVICGEAAPRLPNTICASLPGIAADTQVMALDLAGIAVSAGSACSSGKVRSSHVLEAMGLPPDITRSAIRISLGRETTPDDIDQFTVAWSALVRRLQARRVSA